MDIFDIDGGTDDGVQLLKTALAAVVPAGPDTTHVYFSGTALDRMGAQGGQWFSFRFGTSRWWWLQNSRRGIRRESNPCDGSGRRCNRQRELQQHRPT